MPTQAHCCSKQVSFDRHVTIRCQRPILHLQTLYFITFLFTFLTFTLFYRFLRSFVCTTLPQISLHPYNDRKWLNEQYAHLSMHTCVHTHMHTVLKTPPLLSGWRPQPFRFLQSLPSYIEMYGSQWPQATQHSQHFMPGVTSVLINCNSIHAPHNFTSSEISIFCILPLHERKEYSLKANTFSSLTTRMTPQCDANELVTEN